MSDLLEEKSVMAPQISPKDIPRGEETSDSEEGEPVAPVILENSSSDDEDNMEEDEQDLNGYVQLAQDDNEGQQTPDHWLSNVSTVVYLSYIKTFQCYYFKLTISLHVY